MVRVGLGESGRLVGGHGLLGAMWRGGLGGRRRVGCGEYGGCGAGGAELFTSLFILHGRCLTGGRAVYTSSPLPQHASSVNYSRSAADL